MFKAFFFLFQLANIIKQYRYILHTIGNYWYQNAGFVQWLVLFRYIFILGFDIFGLEFSLK